MSANSEVILVARPVGAPKPADFASREAAAPSSRERLFPASA